MMADQPSPIASWLLQPGQRRPGFYETDPPRMSEEDMDLATGMAYGTPHEPYVRGDRGNREHYARTFVDAQHIPSLLYGLDFSRAQIVDDPKLRSPSGALVHGYYDQISDRAVVSPHEGMSPGAFLSHELWHRGHRKAQRETRKHVAELDKGPLRLRSEDELARDMDRWRLAHTADSHDLMAADDERAGLNRTALTPDSPTDGGRRIANVLAEEIERLRRAGGDFSRMGPR